MWSCGVEGDFSRRDCLWQFISVRGCSQPARYVAPVKMVAAAFAAITGPFDERAKHVDAEPADRALFCRRVQIQCRKT